MAPMSPLGRGRRVLHCRRGDEAQEEELEAEEEEEEVEGPAVGE